LNKRGFPVAKYSKIISDQVFRLRKTFTKKVLTYRKISIIWTLNYTDF